MSHIKTWQTMTKRRWPVDHGVLLRRCYREISERRAPPSATCALACLCLCMQCAPSWHVSKTTYSKMCLSTPFKRWCKNKLWTRQPYRLPSIKTGLWFNWIRLSRSEREGSKIIYIGYWPSVRSRWLDIGQVLFLRVYGPRRSRGP